MQKYFATAESKQIDTTDQGTVTYDEDSKEINDVWQPLWGNGVTIRERALPMILSQPTSYNVPVKVLLGT